MGHVMVTASFSEEIADRLDREARRRELSRSSLLGEVLDEYFRRLDRQEFQSAIRQALANETEEGREEEEAWLRFSRRQAGELLSREDW